MILVDGVARHAAPGLRFKDWSHMVFCATKEAVELAGQSRSPLAFEFIDHVIVVYPGDDPDQVARAWWMRQYGETPEATRSRR